MTTAIPPVIEGLLREASAKGASDIHLIPDEPPVMRIDGLLQRTEGDALSGEQIRDMAAEMIGEGELERIGREVGEVHRSLSLHCEVNAQLSVAKASGNYTIAIRMSVTRIPKPEDIKTPKALLDAVNSSHGLVVISGVTGSGKLTTAITLIEYLNTHHSCLICTIEDPITVRLTPKKSLVRQLEIGLDIPDAVAGISTAVRQDADVVLVSEMKSVEELEACISAAENGHLVIVVMHAATPEDAMHKIITIFPEDIRGGSCRALAKVLLAVSAQRLVPKAKGPGRVAAYGVLVPDNEMRATIAECRSFTSGKISMPEGSYTIADDIGRLLEEGVINEETANRMLGASLR